MTEAHRVADAGAVSREGDRLHVSIEGRYVSLIRDRGELFCMDSICFHAGGPLTIGDIEDIEGQRCVKCPWHHYYLTLKEGEKLYRATEFVDGKLVPAGWKSVGQRHRVHAVEERADGLYVTLDPRPEGDVESDRYAFNAHCGERVASTTLELTKPGGDGKWYPSGSVRRGGR
mmetsp:Transcript_20002/g.65166  ORF Transcript_20002/g.65166 Transcript_20002/m.65166 type:complete len:173 (+) Transcript_20002:36-554(+)